MVKYLFSHIEEFEKFKNDPETAVITDIDGTISQIAPTPDEAVVTPEMRYTLGKMAAKFKLVAVVSGRSVEDARRMVGVDRILYVGNHGLEYMKDDKIKVEPEVEHYIPLVKEVASKIREDKSCNREGVIFEDKGVCFSVHYRLCKEPEKTRKKLLKSIETLIKNGDQGPENLRIREGRKVLEIRPPVDHDKGTILEKLVLENHAGKVIYLGDDLTDNDAFCKLKELKDKVKGQTVLMEGFEGESVIVLSDEVPDHLKENASFFVKNVDEVQKFFEWLLDD